MNSLENVILVINIRDSSLYESNSKKFGQVISEIACLSELKLDFNYYCEQTL